ncbi:MAG: hypothetical protein WB626_11075 [Bacteroidota bacterium]
MQTQFRRKSRVPPPGRPTAVSPSPRVLEERELAGLLSAMRGTARLMGCLLYGAGLSLRECVSLRVRDVDAGRVCIRVRGAAGNPPRETPIPAAVLPDLLEQMKFVRLLARQDGGAVRDGPGADALYLFPACHRPPRTLDGMRVRPHMEVSALASALRDAGIRTGIGTASLFRTRRGGASSALFPPV